MPKKSEKSFTLTEILIVISVIAIVAGLVFVTVGGLRAQARDTKRYAESDTLRTALEYYYYDHKKYPETVGWIKIEEDAEAEGSFFQAMSPYYLPQVPEDPLYPEVEGEKIFSYQYKSTEGGQDYKIHVELEKEETGYYEVASGGGTGIVYGGAYPGITSYALKFDGTNDFVEVPDSGSLDITNTITLEAWAKPYSLSEDRENPILTKASGADWGVYNLVYNAVHRGETKKQFRFEINDGQGASPYKSVFSPVPVYIDHWYHLVGTFDGTKTCIYVNGIQYCEQKGVGITTNNLSFQIGKQYWYDYGPGPEFSYWNGIIDEVRVYNRALSFTEIAEHYNGVFKDEIGLVALWHFDEGSGCTIVDESGNGNMGNLKVSCPGDCPEWVTP